MTAKVLSPAEAERQRTLARVGTEFSKCTIVPFCKACPPEEVMVSMPDGVRLRTLIHRPQLAGTVPTIVMRTCYPANECIYQATAEQYVMRGFALIYQFCRGVGGSEGEWEPNVHERTDGKAALEWICAQPWVGNVGYLGSSYLALTGWAIADIVPNKVKTMYLSHYGTHRFVSAYKDGLFRHDILTSWTMENAGFPIEADYLTSCRHLPQETVDVDLWGQKIDWYRAYLAASDADAPYWNEGVWKDLREIPTRVQLPICFVEAWYDHHLGSAIETWLSMPEETRRHSRLLIGAWDHSFEMRLEDRDGQHYETDDTLRAFDWFYRLLVQEEQPQGGVRYYTIGADRWDDRAALRTETSTMRKLHLSPEQNGRLTESAPTQSGVVAYHYNPNNPVPSHGGEALLRTRWEVGSLRQQPIGARQDIISFVSEPLTKPLMVYGQVKLHLSVASSAPDTAFIFKLMEIREDGTAYNIRTGATTLGYRNGAPHRIAYTPESVVSLTIDSWDIAYCFAAGTHIRLDITSSDFPQYAIHTNYAGAWEKQTAIQTAEQRIFTGGEQASWLELPLAE